MRLNSSSKVKKGLSNPNTAKVELRLSKSQVGELERYGYFLISRRSLSLRQHLGIYKDTYKGAELYNYMKSYCAKGQDNYKRGLLFMQPSLIIPKQAFFHNLDYLDFCLWSEDQVEFLTTSGKNIFEKESPKPVAKKAKQTKKAKESASDLMSRLAL